MPAATSALIGVFPTRGLVSIAGIAPLDWLLDNTGPIARNVTDAAIALGVMAIPNASAVLVALGSTVKIGRRRFSTDRQIAEYLARLESQVVA